MAQKLTDKEKIKELKVLIRNLRYNARFENQFHHNQIIRYSKTIQASAKCLWNVQKKLGTPALNLILKGSRITLSNSFSDGAKIELLKK